MPSTDPHVLARLERYYDAVPRPRSRTEELGPFTLFLPAAASAFYARPRLGVVGPIAPLDVEVVLVRQRELGVPEAIEWVVETTPALAAAARAAGLHVQELPLLVLDRLVAVAPPAGVQIRRVTADEPIADLERILAVAPLAFVDAGTAIGPAGPAERDARAAAVPADRTGLRERLASGAAVLMVAQDVDGPLATGMHQPVLGVSEIVAVATLPTARRRGLASSVTSALAVHALASGVDLIFLSASAEDVARAYERLGFRRAALAGIAERAGG